MPATSRQYLTTRLTALWALSESGLGGIMHAFKIPFTGFVLGGFAIVIITLIAFHADHIFRSIIRSLLLVLLIKAAVSPHSPVMAYVAVGFQGVCGALLFMLIRNIKIAAPLLGILALAESAAQKFLVMTLIYGQNLWEALDLFFRKAVKELGYHTDASFSWWVIGIYTGIYVIWGFLAGIWAGRLPGRLEQMSVPVLLQYGQLQAQHSALPQAPKKKRSNKRLWYIIGILTFITGVFLIQGWEQKALYSLFRTIAVVLLFFFIISPLLRLCIQGWARKQKNRNSTAYQQVMDAIPELKNHIRPAFQLAGGKGLKKYMQFATNWIILSLYHIPSSDEK